MPDGVRLGMNFLSVPREKPEQPGTDNGAPSFRPIRNPLLRCWRNTMLAAYESPQTVLLSSVWYPFLSLMIGSMLEHLLQHNLGALRASITGAIVGLMFAPPGMLFSATAVYRALHPGKFRDAETAGLLRRPTAVKASFLILLPSLLAACFAVAGLFVYSRLPVPFGPILTVITAYAAATWYAFAFLHPAVLITVLLGEQREQGVGGVVRTVFSTSWQLLVTAPTFHFCNLFAAGLVAALCARTVFLVPIALGGVVMLLSAVSVDQRLAELKSTKAGTEHPEGDLSL